MRWPIRNQILIPFLLIQTGTVLLVTIASAWVALRQIDGLMSERLESVASTLRGANYPLTPAILEQMEGLSHADFILLDQEGHAILSTLPKLNLGEFQKPESVRSPQSSGVFDSERLIKIDGKRYYAGLVEQQRWRTPRQILILYPADEWEAARWRAMFPPLLIGILLLVLTVIASFLISQRISRRIRRVQQHVSRIATGEFSEGPVLKTNDELRDLSLDVKRMAHVLDQSMRRIRETERTAMLTQLSSGMAHQLRNALTGARVSVQLHQRHCDNKDDEALSVALRQLRLTEEQIKTLLRLSRGESEEETPGNLDEILEDVKALILPLCEHQNIECECQHEPANLTVENSSALRGALLNLTMNAIDAAGPHGSIEVKQCREDDKIVIEIRDSGPGVPAEFTEEIFTPFFTTKREGAGLGLAIARQAVEDCEGTLTLEQHDGTCFRLSLAGNVAAETKTTVSEIL